MFADMLTPSSVTNWQRSLDS